MRNTEEESVYSKVSKIYLRKDNEIANGKEWRKYESAFLSLKKAADKAFHHRDTKFNAVHWAFNVDRLCREIIFSFCWMNAYAEYYRNQIKPGSKASNTNAHVSYFADNCITRPEKKNEVLDYKKIIERFKYPLKFGLNIKGYNGFLTCLKSLKDDNFRRVVVYRHLKIHRMEPRIEIYGAKSHHGWPYMLPLFSDEEIECWKKKFKKDNPDPKFRELIMKSCYIDGILYESRKIKDSIWHFNTIQSHIEECMTKLIKASAECFSMLRRRAPLNKK
jgi:hypothetical protein